MSFYSYYTILLLFLTTDSMDSIFEISGQIVMLRLSFSNWPVRILYNYKFGCNASSIPSGIPQLDMFPQSIYPPHPAGIASSVGVAGSGMQSDQEIGQEGACRPFGGRPLPFQLPETVLMQSTSSKACSNRRLFAPRLQRQWLSVGWIPLSRKPGVIPSAVPLKHLPAAFEPATIDSWDTAV